MTVFKRAVTVSALWAASAISLYAQPVVVADVPIECWPTDAHRFARTTFAPPADALTLKLYFRSVTEPDFHFVEATTDRQGRAVAILPIARPETRQVVFFAELVTRSYVAVRTAARTVPTMSQSECSERDPAAAWYQGSNADITVGATRPGVPMPNGFRPDGISRFIEVGSSTGGGSGGSSLPWILAGGGGAAAVGAFTLGGGGNESDTGAPIGGGGLTTTTTAATTTVGGGGTTTVTTTAGGGGPAPPTTSLPGPTTSSTSGPTTSTSGPTTTAPGSTTSSPGSTTSTTGSTTSSPGTTTSSPTTSVATTSVATTSVATTTSIDAGTVADVGVSISSPPSAVLLTGFNVTVTGFNNGPDPASVFGRVPVPPNAQKTGGACGTGALLVCNFGTLNSGQSGQMVIGFRGTSVGNVTFTVEVNSNTDVDNVPSNDSDSSVTVITASLRAGTTTQIGFVSDLRAENGDAARVHLTLNGESSVWLEPGRQRLSIDARVGENQLEIRSPFEKPNGFLRLDFGDRTAGLVPGSIRLLSGNVLSIEPTAVSMNLAAAIRLTFNVQDARQD